MAAGGMVVWLGWTFTLPLIMAAGLLLELRPADLVEKRLEDLLRLLVKAARAQSGITVNLMVEEQAALPPKVQAALYHIAQEALNNALQHAGASQVTVRLCSNCAEGGSAHTVLLSVIDDGSGFDLDRAPQNRLGLKGMRAWAQQIGATLFIDSYPGEGTQITVLWERAGKAHFPE